tara:strand:- start:1102 stop:2343 length:1242 start_codon:yes stop_codon:yes gene_type:complete
MNPYKKNVFILLSLCFLDMLSYAMFSPLAAFLFLDGKFSLLPETVSNRHFLLGCFLSIYSVMQILSAPFWGQVAIALNKKKVLLFSYLGSILGYTTCMLGIYFKEITFFFIGSFISGTTGSNMAMVNAFISQDENRKHWSQIYSLFGGVIGLAWIIGPQAVKLIMLKIDNFNLYYLVLIICTCISIMNFISVKINLKEEKENSYFKFKKANFFTIFSKKPTVPFNKKSLFILMYMFCIYFSWFYFLKFFQVILFDKFYLDETKCIEMTSFLGLSCAVWQLLRFLNYKNWFEKKFWLTLSTALMAASTVFLMYATTINELMITVIVISFSYSVIIPSVVALFLSEGDGAKELKASWYQSAQSLAKILSPLLSGYVLSYSEISPILVSSFFLCFAFFILLSMETKSKKYSEVLSS